MCSGDVQIVDLDGYLREDRLDEAPSSGLSSGIRKFDANQELGRSHRRYDDVVIVARELLEVTLAALCGDENTCVENQSFQRDSSSVSESLI